MAVAVFIMFLIISLHLIAFILVVGFERRCSIAKVVSNEYDERTYVNRVQIDGVWVSAD